MLGKYIISIIVGILLVGAGSRLIYYGIKAGLIDKKVILKQQPNLPVIGNKAIRYGWIFIAAGIISISGFVIYILISWQFIGRSR
jgi:divalent metal cation (Fe/Co/Zn/Cd) transporter